MAKLAALGGTPVAKDGMNIVWPVIGEEEREAMRQTLERKVWCRFEMPDDQCQAFQFEQEWETYHDAKHCVVICNGTAALMCAFRALGVGHGDEVIVPAITFCATSDAVVLCGGVPVFVDMVPETYQIAPDAIEAAVTDRTKAICIVHYGGYPCDLDRLVRVAAKTGLPIIEDCAHAQGTEWRGRKVGAHLTGGCFSFQQSKSLTCGEGGAVVTDSEEFADAIWAVHNCGRFRGAYRYDHTALGGNFRLGEFESTILRAQLKRLPEQTTRRMENAAFLMEAIRGMDGLDVLKPDDRVTQRGYYFYVIRYNSEAWGGVNRDTFARAMIAEGIPFGRGYGVPVYRTSSYSDGIIPHRAMYCPNAERATADEQITLMNHVLLERENIRMVIDALTKTRENLDELRRFERNLTAG